MSRKVRQFTISNKLVIRTPMTALVLSLAQLMVAYRTSCVVIAEKQPFSILRCFNHQLQCSQRPIAPTDQSFSDLQLVANCHQPVGKIWVISPLRIHLVFNRLVLLPAPTNGGQLVLDYLNQKMPGILDGGTCMVDARDVAQAMINAVEHGKSGERYITAGQYFTVENLFQILEKVSSVPSPKRRIPYIATLIYAWFSDKYALLTGSKSMLPLDGVRLMHLKRQVSSAKAIKELGVSFRPLDETLGDVVEWYRRSRLR